MSADILQRRENARKRGARYRAGAWRGGDVDISKVFAQYLARMRRIEHLGHDVSSRDSPGINENCVFSIETESEPPVAIDLIDQ